MILLPILFRDSQNKGPSFLKTAKGSFEFAESGRGIATDWSHLGPPPIQHTAVSINWGVLFLSVLVIRDLLFGVYIRDPDVWKLPCTIYHISYTLDHILHAILRALLSGAPAPMRTVKRGIAPFAALFPSGEETPPSA